MDILKKFLIRLYRHTIRKDNLYDGNSNMSIDEALRYATEELGEVATSITRERYSTTLDECIDLAHCAFLIYRAVVKESKDDR